MREFYVFVTTLVFIEGNNCRATLIILRVNKNRFPYETGRKSGFSLFQMKDMKNISVYVEIFQYKSQVLKKKLLFE